MHVALATGFFELLAGSISYAQPDVNTNDTGNKQSYYLYTTYPFMIDGLCSMWLLRITNSASMHKESFSHKIFYKRE